MAPTQTPVSKPSDGCKGGGKKKGSKGK